MDKNDKYIHGMDWAEGKLPFSDMLNYRSYQYDLIGKYVGANILEVGTGDRSFTHQICTKKSYIERLFSIEPSTVLFNLPGNQYEFPDYVRFESVDLFNLNPAETGLFDTIIFIHILKHIQDDKGALEVANSLVKEGGFVLIEVPALPWLFSVHDEMLGHFRRYNKPMLRSIIETNNFMTIKMWYQDPIGVLGSLFYFKMKKVKLKSKDGRKLVENKAPIYDKYIIPFEKKLENIITFPFGLSLTTILKKI